MAHPTTGLSDAETAADTSSPPIADPAPASRTYDSTNANAYKTAQTAPEAQRTINSLDDKHRTEDQTTVTNEQAANHEANEKK